MDSIYVHCGIYINYCSNIWHHTELYHVSTKPYCDSDNSFGAEQRRGVCFRGAGSRYRREGRKLSGPRERAMEAPPGTTFSLGLAGGNGSSTGDDRFREEEGR